VIRAAGVTVKARGKGVEGVEKCTAIMSRPSGRVLLRFLSISGTLGQRGGRVTGTWALYKGRKRRSDSGRHGDQDGQQARGDVLVKRRRIYEDDVESWEGEEGVDEDKEGVQGGQGDVVASSSSPSSPSSS
jgi:hypothetical protein